MPKLKKEDFDRAHRFREARKEGLVACASCATMSGGVKRDEVALCDHPERFRKVKIAEYLGGGWWGKGESKNISSERVCDAYSSKPLPEVAVIPVIPKKHVIRLGSQSKDTIHADPNCPYVVEEVRRAMLVTPETIKAEPLTGYLTRPGIHFQDISEHVPGEIIGGQICEMHCCDSKLPFQMSPYNRGDNYRGRVGIKPDGSEPRIWVRNNIVKHENKGEVAPEQVGNFFDLSKFNSSDFRTLHDQIWAAINHLWNCNRLGSRPLSEAVNPVSLYCQQHFFEGPIQNPCGMLEFWAYDDRLFDSRTELKGPIRSLEKIPEGFIPCIDTEMVLDLRDLPHPACPSYFKIFGIVKPVEDRLRLPKEITHFVQIGAIDYHDSNALMGVSGKGFHGAAYFTEQ